MLGLAGVLFGGYPIFREAFDNIRERRMTMELSMTIALLAALFIREFFTALVIAVFVLVAEVLEGLTVGRGRRAIADLLDFLPHSTCIVKNGGACGIAAGTPLAILGAIGRAARQGAIIKGGTYLEQLAKVDTILLDKTGTLTYGKPRVVAIEPINGFEKRAVLEIAAIAERNSEHPLAQAVLAAARENQIAIAEPSYFEYAPGKGVRAGLHGHCILAGNPSWLNEAGIELPALPEVAGTRILVARDFQLIGSIHIADQVRGEAAEAIRQLKQMGLQIELLTGDTAQAAKAVAESIGVNRISSELLPGQKSARVDELIQSGRTVAMIGDGINDAPALSHAQIGVAMGTGTEVAHASANVLLIGNDLRKFVETFKTARWCHSVIFQNFYGTLAVDGLGIILAAIGIINPLVAAFIHVSSELAFILNSTRLLPISNSSSRS